MPEVQVVLKIIRLSRWLYPFFVSLPLIAWPLNAPAQSQASKNQSSTHSITVRDAIELTRLADPDYFHNSGSKGRVPLFSPDGKLFLILLRKGNLEKNTNEFSLLLYRTAEALRSP